MTFGEQPAYLRVAGDLRQKIVEGLLPPHTRLPSQARIREEYGVSDTVALEARKVLMAEGLVEGRSGSGTYVRERPEPRRVARSGFRPERGRRPSVRSRPTSACGAPGSPAVSRRTPAWMSPSGSASTPGTA